MQNSMSMARLGLYYVGYFILFFIGMNAIFFALAYFFNYTLSTDITPFLVPAFAALQCGTLWVDKTGTRPATGQVWTAAAMFTLLTLLVGCVNLFIFYRLDFLPEADQILADPQAPKIVGVILAIVLAVIFLLCALTFWLGARARKKQKDKLSVSD